MERITAAEIEEMRARGYDRSTIAEYEDMLRLCEQADVLIERIDAAFRGVELEDGIGLRESNGIDDYAPPDELKKLRASDEKHDWRKIPPELLSHCNAAPSFLDGKGLRFHAPAFLVAELRGQYQQAFIDLLIGDGYAARDFVSLLSDAQREVLIDCIRLYGSMYGFSYDAIEIERAVARFSSRD